MIKYIGKRILMLIPVLLGVVLLVFSMMYFSPGNAEDYILGDMATEEDKEAFREENGLNKPFLSSILIMLRMPFGEIWVFPIRQNNLYLRRYSKDSRQPLSWLFSAPYGPLSLELP